MLSGQNIRKSYGAFVALGGVSISVEGGRILGVAGPNGAGKTTLFDVLTGRVKPDSGTAPDCEGGVATARAGLLLAARYPFLAVPREDGGNINGVDQTKNALMVYPVSGTSRTIDVAGSDLWGVRSGISSTASDTAMVCTPVEDS